MGTGCKCAGAEGLRRPPCLRHRLMRPLRNSTRPNIIPNLAIFAPTMRFRRKLALALKGDGVRRASRRGCRVFRGDGPRGKGLHDVGDAGADRTGIVRRRRAQAPSRRRQPRPVPHTGLADAKRARRADARKACPGARRHCGPTGAVTLPGTIASPAVAPRELELRGSMPPAMPRSRPGLSVGVLTARLLHPRPLSGAAGSGPPSPRRRSLSAETQPEPVREPSRSYAESRAAAEPQSDRQDLRLRLVRRDIR